MIRPLTSHPIGLIAFAPAAQQLINHQPPQARCGFSRVALCAAVAVASQMTLAAEPPAAAQQMVLFSEDIAAQLDWQPLPLLTEATSGTSVAANARANLSTP